MVWDSYANAIDSLIEMDRFFSFVNHEGVRDVSHLIFLEMESEQSRENLRTHLISQGVQATSHYRPLNSSHFGKHFGTNRHRCGNSQSFSEQILRLPLHFCLTSDDVQKVVKEIANYKLLKTEN